MTAKSDTLKLGKEVREHLATKGVDATKICFYSFQLDSVTDEIREQAEILVQSMMNEIGSTTNSKEEKYRELIDTANGTGFFDAWQDCMLDAVINAMLSVSTQTQAKRVQLCSTIPNLSLDDFKKAKEEIVKVEKSNPFG
jgi:hypothetical protein